jgi:type IX secretion system PorP/SprF family membrane protein
MKNLYASLLFLTVSMCAVAQQDPLYTQYLLNPLIINPAYSGLNNNFNAMVGYRTQWTGLEGQPQTINASIHTSLVDNKVGAGVLVINDKIGNMTSTEANATFSYKLNFNESTFSFGMQAGVQNFRTDYSGLNIRDMGDAAFTGGERGTRINMGAGVALKSEKFFVGLSVPRLLPTRFKNGGSEFDLYNQHFYLTGSYVYYVNEKVRLKPSVLLRGVKGAPASVDFAVSANFNTLHTVGLFTRNLNTYGILLQTLLAEKYRFGYAFEIPTSKSVGTSFSTHELTLGVLLSVFDFHDRTFSNF